MKLTQEQKDEIRGLAKAYVDRYPSQAKAANSLKGIISTGTLSTLLNGKYESISDEMFLRLRAQVADKTNREWQICETQMFRTLTTLLEEAQEYHDVAWAVSPAGAGKTATARIYAAEHENAFHVLCSEDMRRGDFVQEMARMMGIDVMRSNPRVALRQAVRYLQTLDRPLLIFDESDKLSDDILYYFITIYNILKGHCGMFFLSTGDYIDRRIKNGIVYKKKGYDEIHSRICRELIKLPTVSDVEVAAIVRANGVVDEKLKTKILEKAKAYRNDLRYVENIIARKDRKTSVI